MFLYLHPLHRPVKEIIQVELKFQHSLYRLDRVRYQKMLHSHYCVLDRVSFLVALVWISFELRPPYREALDVLHFSALKKSWCIQLVLESHPIADAVVVEC